MNKVLIKYLSFIGSIYILSWLIGSITIKSITALLIMGFVLLLVNLILKPILLLVTLPLSIITLGLFSFFVNAWTIMIADFFVPGIHMGGFLNSLITALVIVILQHLLKDSNKRSIR